MTEPSSLANTEIRTRLIAALNELYATQSDLLENETNERSAAHHFAICIAATFPEWHVDVEYNRMGDRVKRLRECVPEHVHSTSIHGGAIFPDIIVHKRGQQGPNVLVVELKKTNNPDRGGDVCKLKAMTAPAEQLGFGYELGALVIVGPKEPGPIRWFAGGEELPQ